MRYLRRNLITVVFVVDVTNAKSLQTVQLGWQLLLNMAPIRLGYVLLDGPIQGRSASADHEAPNAPGDDIGIMALRMFTAIERRHNTRLAMKFLSTVASSVASMPPSSAGPANATQRILRDAYASVGMPIRALDDVTRADSPHDALRIATRRLVRRCGIRDAPVMLVNGEYYAIGAGAAADAEDGATEQQLMQAYFKHVHTLINAVYHKQVTDATNLHEWWAQRLMAKPRINTYVAGLEGAERARWVPLHGTAVTGQPAPTMPDLRSLVRHTLAELPVFHRSAGMQPCRSSAGAGAGGGGGVGLQVAESHRPMCVMQMRLR